MWKNNVEGIRDKAAVALAKKSLLDPKTASAEVCASPVALSDEDEKSSNSIRLMHIIGDSAIHDSPNRLNLQTSGDGDNTGNKKVLSIDGSSVYAKSDFEIDVSANTSITHSVILDATELALNTTLDVAHLKDSRNASNELLSVAACQSEELIVRDLEFSLPSFKRKKTGRCSSTESLESRLSNGTGSDSVASESDCNEVKSSSDESESDSNQSESHSDESVGSVLPPKVTNGTRNKFCRHVGELKVASLKLLQDDETIDNDEIRRCIVQVMAKDFNYPCTLSFYGSIRKNKSSCVTYARCLYVKHKIAFRFHIVRLETPIAIIVIRKTKSKNISHTGVVIYRQLRTKERAEKIEEMKHKTPRAVQQKVIRNLNPELVMDGNMQDMRILSTFQKAKSEYNCRNDEELSSRDLSDILSKAVKDQHNADPYIRYVGLPLHCIMYSENLLNVASPKNGILHMDSTGSVVRKPTGIICKRIFYYAIVMKSGESILPVAEMISAQHDVPSISVFLKRYRHFVESSIHKWPFKMVVVDWSWALINSVMKEWNNTSITEYLKHTYLCLTNDTYINSDFTVVQTCYSHFMKRVSNNLDKKFKNYKNKKSIIMEGVAAMALCRTLDELNEVFDEVMTILVARIKVKHSC